MAQLGSTTIYGDLTVTESIYSNVSKINSPVAFDVATTTQTAATNKIVWNTVYVNVGNGYSSTTGRFTAPIKGTYVFYTACIKNGANTTLVNLVLYKNGVPSNGGRRKRLNEGGAYGDNSVGSWIVDLNIGDYVEVWVTAGTTYNTLEYEIFNGFLLI